MLFNRDLIHICDRCGQYAVVDEDDELGKKGIINRKHYDDGWRIRYIGDNTRVKLCARCVDDFNLDMEFFMREGSYSDNP